MEPLGMKRPNNFPRHSRQKMSAMLVPSYIKFMKEYTGVHSNSLKENIPEWWIPTAMPDNIRKKLTPHREGNFIQEKTYRRFFSNSVWADEWLIKNGTKYQTKQKFHFNSK